MRTLLATGFVALMLGLTPAAAMCGGGQASGQGGMCGRTTAVDDPFNDKPAMSKKPAAGMSMMCGCCKNMASMGGMGGMGGMKEDDPHKGMDMPKQ